MQNQTLNSIPHSPGFALRRVLHSELDVEAWITSLARGASFAGWVVVSDARDALELILRSAIEGEVSILS